MSVIVVNARVEAGGSKVLTINDGVIRTNTLTLPSNSTFYLNISCICRLLSTTHNNSTNFMQKNVLITYGTTIVEEVIPTNNLRSGISTIDVTTTTSGVVSITVSSALVVSSDEYAFVATIILTECVF
jgi:hypothetical protein